ncbi:MBL fold metallo-hydrolase, partial [Acinetobacter baumannii]
SDHCGGNAALHAAYGCRIAIPAAEDAKVRQWDEDALSSRATGQRCPRFVHEQLIRSGDVLSLGDLDWTALAAPGHDPHALLLYCAQEGVLI